MKGPCGKIFESMIAMQDIGRISTWSKTGYNAAVGAASEDMWVVSTPNNWPAAAMNMEVVSSAAADTIAGNNIQQVRVGYLDANYAEQSIIVNMAGVAPVALGVNVLRVQDFRAYSYGVNPVAAGNIDIRMIGGAATIYSRIGTGFNRARNDQWTVPYNKTLYVTSIAFSSTSNAAQNATIFTTRATFDDSTARLLTPGLFFMPYHEIGIMDGAFFRELEIPTKLPATVDLKVSAQSLNAATVCTSVLRGYTVTA